jgi:hypothetical protein
MGSLLSALLILAFSKCFRLRVSPSAVWGFILEGRGLFVFEEARARGLFLFLLLFFCFGLFRFPICYFYAQRGGRSGCKNGRGCFTPTGVLPSRG